MKIKTSDTFFPTKFRPTTAKTNEIRQNQINQNTRSYKLVKKRSSTHQSYLQNINQSQSTNIFKNIQIENSQFNYQKDRPIGGIDIFLKQHNKKIKTGSHIRIPQRINSAEHKKKQYENQQKPTIIYNKNNQNLYTTEQENKQKKQQIFKQQHPYNSLTSSKSMSHPKKQTKNKTNTHINSSTINRNIQHNNWITKQTEQYQNKMSVLNQLYYKKPLVQQYGDRYFQYFLRNRYEEDFPPPVFIHQIKSDVQARNANNDKFLSKIKKINSNVRNFQKLVVKGKHFTVNKFLQNDTDV